MVWLETVHARTRGGLTGRNAGPGRGRSRIQHLLSAGLCPVKRWLPLFPTAEAQTEIKARGGDWLQRRGQRRVYRGNLFFFSFAPSKKRNASAVQHPLHPEPNTLLFIWMPYLNISNSAQVEQEDPHIASSYRMCSQDRSEDWSRMTNMVPMGSSWSVKLLITYHLKSLD